MNDFNNIYKRFTDPHFGVHLCHTYNYHAYSSDIASIYSRGGKSHLPLLPDKTMRMHPLLAGYSVGSSQRDRLGWWTGGALQWLYLFLLESIRRNFRAQSSQCDLKRFFPCLFFLSPILSLNLETNTTPKVFRHSYQRQGPLRHPHHRHRRWWWWQCVI